MQITRRKASAALPEDDSLPPLLRRLYELRGIHRMEDVDFGLSRLSTYKSLPGVDVAVETLEQALRRQARVLIVGDYDADGTVGTVVLCKALRAFGYQQVDYMVPDRFRFGYGLSPQVVAAAIQEKQPELIVTVDNGVASVEGVDEAKRNGIEVIITDHHLPADQLPAAAAIVNPNLPGSDFPCKALAGVGVAFYLMIALRRRLDKQGLLDAASVSLAELLDLVAVGTVADIVPMDKDNRILVEQGLRRIRSGKCSPGLRALFKIAKRDLTKAVTADLGFAVGPRLNAAGRLEDTATGIACLLCDDENKAFSLAVTLDELNQRRKELQQQMQQSAQLHLEAIPEPGAARGLCLYDASWHEGIVGLIAARLKDRYHRPVVVFAKSGEAVLKGSARSIADVHIRDLFERIAVKSPQLISRFGGHAMAAGLSLPLDHFEQFKEAYDKELESCLDESLLSQRLLSDGELSGDDINYETARQIREAAPWGKDFPEPLFDGLFKVVEATMVHDRHLRLLICMVNDPDRIFRAIFFNFYDSPFCGKQQYLEQGGAQVHLAYRLEPDDYGGRQAALLNVQYLEVEAAPS